MTAPISSGFARSGIAAIMNSSRGSRNILPQYRDRVPERHAPQRDPGLVSGNKSQVFSTARTPILPGQQLQVREAAMPPSDEQASILRDEGADAIVVDANRHLGSLARSPRFLRVGSGRSPLCTRSPLWADSLRRWPERPHSGRGIEQYPHGPLSNRRRNCR